MHVSVRTKIFAVVLLPVLVLSALILAGVGRLNSATAFAVRVNRAEEAAAAASSLRFDVLTQQTALKNMMLRVTQPVEYARQSAIFDESGKQAAFHRETLGNALSLLGADDLAPLLARFDAAYTAYGYDAVNALRAAKAAGGPNPGNGDAVVRGSEHDTQEALDELAAGLAGQATATRAAQVAVMRSIAIDSLVALLLAAVAVLVAGWVLACRIGEDVNAMAQAALNIAREGRDPVVVWPGSMPHAASSPAVGPFPARPSDDDEPLPAGLHDPAVDPGISKRPTAIIAVNLHSATRDLHQAAKNLNETGKRLSEAMDNEAVDGVENARPADGSQAPKVLPPSVRLADKLGDESRQVRTLIGSLEDMTSQAYMLALRALAESLKGGAQGQAAAQIADAVIRLAERSTRENDQLVHLLGDVQESADRAVGRAQQESGPTDWDDPSDGGQVAEEQRPVPGYGVPAEPESVLAEEQPVDEESPNQSVAQRFSKVRRAARRRQRRIHPAA